MSSPPAQGGPASSAFDLSGQVAIVTGGTAGIGRAIVERFLGAGASVAFCCPIAAESDETARELETLYPGRVAGLLADLEDITSLVAMVDQVTERWGRVDILICNAALMGGHGNPMDVDTGLFERILRVNTINNFELIRKVLPLMLEMGNGNIVLITTLGAYGAYPQVMAYGAAKAAVASMGKNLAAAYADKGVRINCVMPGLVRTRSSEPVWSDPDKLAAYVNVTVPMPRIGEPEEIAAACHYVVSRAGSYLTGATIPVDGGRHGLGEPQPMLKFG